jgi:TM2 domain-containing membrane protein YozV
MNPTQTPFPNIIPKKQRHYLAAFFLSFVWGIVGADRFYLGKYWTGLLKLVTLGGVGIWVLVDLGSIMAGTMRDKQGNPLLQYSEYRSLSRKVVAWFTFATLLIFTVTAVSVVAAIYFLFTNMDAIQDGSLLQSLPGLPSIPGIPTGQNAFEMYNIE